MIDIINEILKFFHFSLKRQRYFESILDKDSESHAVKQLKEDRGKSGGWNERHTYCETFYSLHRPILSLFRRNAPSLTRE